MDQRSDSQTATICSNRRTLCFDDSIIGPWVVEATNGGWINGQGSAIGQLQNGQLNAGVLYENFNGVNVCCHIRGVGSWANRRFLGLIFDYPFNMLKAKRITVWIDDDNKASIALVKQMGFALESRLEQANPRGGDILLFRMFRDDCKYLRGKYALPA